MGSCTMHSQSGKGRSDTIDYIQSMLGQLRNMAQAERYDVLAYLIEMAYVEAGDILVGQRPSAMAEKKRNSSS